MHASARAVNASRFVIPVLDCDSLFEFDGCHPVSVDNRVSSSAISVSTLTVLSVSHAHDRSYPVRPLGVV